MTGKRRLGEVVVTAAGLAITLSAAMALAIVLIFLLSKNPGRTIYYFFIGPFTNRYYLGEICQGTARVLCTGLPPQGDYS